MLLPTVWASLVSHLRQVPTSSLAIPISRINLYRSLKCEHLKKHVQFFHNNSLGRSN